MSKKTKKDKGPKLYTSPVIPTGEFNQDYVNDLKRIISMKKQIAIGYSNVREAHADVKKKYNIPAYASRNQVKLMMMDPETRTEIERNIEISRRMVGDQLSFELVPDARKAVLAGAAVVGKQTEARH